MRSGGLKLWLIGIALVGSFVAWEWLRSPPAVAHRSTDAAAATRWSTPAASSPIQPAPVVAQANQPLAPVAATPANLASKLLTATDWRVFYEYARQHPAAGGMFYASEAALACGEARIQLRFPIDQQRYANASGAVAQAWMAARDVLQARCGSFLEAEVDLRHAYDLRIAEGRRAGDPLAIVYDDLRKAWADPASGSKNAAFQRALESADPFILHSVSARTMPILEGVAIKPELYAAAWGLAICSLGIDCSLQTVQSLLPCAMAGPCSASLQALLEQTAAEQVGADRMPQVQALAAKIAANVQARNARAFVLN
jgi:hypothetical protein